MKQLVIVERIRKLHRLAESTPFPDEAKTAHSLASTLMAKHGLTEADVHPKPETTINPLDLAMAFWRFWGFHDWRATSEYRYQPRPREYPSGDKENRDFSAYIGRRCSTDREFKAFWDGMSKDERRLWRRTYYEPKRKARS